MKAMVVRDYGGPEVLRLEDLPSPDVPADHVKVRVRACGVNFADTLLIRGQYQVKPDFPFSPGLEVAGEIIEAGAGVSWLKAGQRVLAITGYGGYAQEVVVPGRAATPIPDTMDDKSAAAFAVAYGTSHLALDHKAGLKAGEVLLVHGASGGVGLTAVEIGKHMGATVIATASTMDKLNVAKCKGADHLILSSAEDMREQIKALTKGKGADVIYDPVGGDLAKTSLRAINFEGRYVVIGFASGTIPQFPANIVLVKNIDVMGLFWGAYATKRPEIMSQSLQTLLGWYENGALRPHISHTYALADAADAMTLMLERKSTGKIVIEVG